MTESVTALLPPLIAAGSADAAFRLALSIAAQPEWLPEALTLFNTPGLSALQQRQMLGGIFPGIPAEAALPLARVCARLGSYGFSFPLWRFAAQGFEGASLLSRFGMCQLRRVTDTRDARLPDPARDLFGTGFLWRKEDLYIEYRRAYLVFANAGAALVIRNNSFYFGRDRLPAPVYISFAPPPAAALEELDIAGLRSFAFLPQILSAAPDIPLPEKIRRVDVLLDAAGAFDLSFSRWLFGGDALYAFLNWRLKTNPVLPVIAAIDPRLPPWFPQNPVVATAEMLRDERNLAIALQPLRDLAVREGLKLVLLSGSRGDLPS